MPDLPGVYQFFDTDGHLLYIGKAKSLKKRVSSYFNRTNQTNTKLRTLVRKISSIKFVVVDSESDALLLENVLIKKHQPKYNILLKDDKTYPWTDLAAVEHQDLISLEHGTDTLCHHKTGAPLHQYIQRILNPRLGLNIHRGSAVI